LGFDAGLSHGDGEIQPGITDLLRAIGDKDSFVVALALIWRLEDRLWIDEDF
jgi:hypothetical protein